jgi:hypothetical protein
MSDYGGAGRREREEETQENPSPLGSALKGVGLAEHIIPRLLRNIAIVAFLLVGPIFWVYRLVGAVGFAFGAGVSYINFSSLSRGVEGLTARVVDQQSKEKGGRIILRFVFRYVLVGGVAYVIFKGSPLAFRGFLWGLCVPAAALMAEAVWQGFTAFRRI